MGGEQDPNWIDQAALSWTPPEPWRDESWRDVPHARREPRFSQAAALDTAPLASARPITQARPALPAQTNGGASAFLLCLIVGMLQGLALLWLFQSRDAGTWPGNDAYLTTALTMALVFAPLLLVQGLGRIPAGILLPWTLLAAAGLAALGFYHRWRVGGADPGHAGLAMAAMAALFLFIVQGLLVAASREGTAVPRYRVQFDSAWELAAQIFFAALFAGLCWTLIGAAYGWLRTHAPRLEPELLTMPLVGLAAALAARIGGGSFAKAAARVLAVLLRTLLPLAILITLGEMAAALLGLRQASLTLWLAMAAGIILCLNASYGGGDEYRPMWRRKCEFVAAFLLAPLAILGGLALMARVAGYGWTSERIFAASLLMALAAYALCYAGAALISLGGGRWMERLENANLMMAFVSLAMIAAMASPFADPVRLAVEAQSFRAENDIVPAGAFDFAWLHHDGLRFGHDALARMSGIKTNAALSRGAYLALMAPPDAAPTPTEIGANIAVRTQGARLPPGLLARDWAQAGPHVPPCLTNAALSCDAYFLDLDGDGVREIMLVYGNDAAWWGAVMKQGAPNGQGGWYVAATLASPPCPGGLSALRAGDFAPVTPGWRDLMVAGQRLVVSLTGSGKPPICSR